MRRRVGGGGGGRKGADAGSGGTHGASPPACCLLARDSCLPQQAAHRERTAADLSFAPNSPSLSFPSPHSQVLLESMRSTSRGAARPRIPALHRTWIGGWWVAGRAGGHTDVQVCGTGRVARACESVLESTLVTAQHRRAQCTLDSPHTQNPPTHPPTQRKKEKKERIRPWPWIEEAGGTHPPTYLKTWKARPAAKSATRMRMAKRYLEGGGSVGGEAEERRCRCQ